jgi:hypothetical protein
MLSPDIHEVQLGARAIDVSAGSVNVSVRVRVPASAGTGQIASGVTAVNVFVGSAERQQVDTHPRKLPARARPSYTCSADADHGGALL